MQKWKFEKSKFEKIAKSKKNWKFETKRLLIKYELWKSQNWKFEKSQLKIEEKTEISKFWKIGKSKIRKSKIWEITTQNQKLENLKN